MDTLAATIDRYDEPWKRLTGGFYSIVDKQGHIVPFVPNVTQEELAGLLHGRDIILKARQRGITTLMCLIALDECLFIPNWNAAIIAHRLTDAKTIFDSKVRFPYDNLPDSLKERIPTVRDAADTLHFANGSSISVTTSARSGTLQRLHVSEFGKICAQYPIKAREIVTGSFPAAEMGAITIESTAEGQEGRFFEMTQTARSMVGRITPSLPHSEQLSILTWLDPSSLSGRETSVGTDRSTCRSTLRSTPFHLSRPVSPSRSRSTPR